jgi:hypothetical protein
LLVLDLLIRREFKKVSCIARRNYISLNISREINVKSRPADIWGISSSIEREFRGNAPMQLMVGPFGAK